MDIYITDKLLTRIPFSLTFIMIFHMHEIVVSTLDNKAFGFPCYLHVFSNIFKLIFLGKGREVITTMDVIDDNLIWQCSYTYDKETKEWRKPAEVNPNVSKQNNI